MKNYKGKFKEYQDLANFQEPVMMFMRNSRKVEFYENVTTGFFHYTHTDGTVRKIKISPEFMHTFDYGKNNFKGYICHEDHPTPLPEKPVVTAEQFQWAIDKTQQDLMNHREKELTAKGDMWYKILIGIAIVIGVLAFAKMIVPDFFNFFSSGGEAVKEAGKNAGETIARNVSINP